MEPTTLANTTQTSFLTSHQKTAGLIEKRLPAPTPQVRTEQSRTGTRVEWRREGRRRESRRWGGGLFSLFGSPQRAQRPQRILLPWLCILRVLCGVVFHQNYILTAAGSEQTQLPFRTPGPPVPIHPQGSTKAPASPRTTRAGGADRDGHPGGVMARGWRQESRKVVGF